MKSKFITVYAVLVSLIFVGALFFLGFNVFSEYNAGYARTRSQFDRVTAEIRLNVKKYPLDSEEYNKCILNAFGNMDDYSHIEVMRNGQKILNYPEESLTPSENTKYVRLYFTSTKIGEDNYYISAALYTIRPSAIVYYTKISFIIILIFTVITILVIVYINMTFGKSNAKEISGESSFEPVPLKADYNSTSKIEKSENEKTEETPSPAETDKSADSVNPVVEATEVTSAEETAAKTAEPPKAYEPQPPAEQALEKASSTVINEANIITQEESEALLSGELLSDETANDSQEQKEEEKPAPADLPLEDDKPAEIEKSDSQNPQGLFSPATGFGWESYLKTRLESELNRASASEFDVTLFLIKLQNIERTDDCMKQVCEYLTSTFQFNDMIFEYKDDSFACIKTNLTIDEAIPLADTIHSELSSYISDVNGRCFIGITSKTIRLINADRMLIEADAALERAENDPSSPIIAFRANAEKYMRFVEER